MALPFALAISCVFTIVGTTIFVYSTGTGRQAYYGATRQGARALAEAGLNNALSVVSRPGTNPLDPYLFCSAGESLPCPPRNGTVDGQSIGWTGTLDQTQSPAVWTLKGSASVRNPTGPKASPITRTMTAQVRVIAVYTQALANPVWDYVYVYGSGDPSGCDYTQLNNSVMGSPLYVTGNACLYNSAWISGGPLQVKGTLSFNSPQNSVGSVATPITTGVHIGGGCKPVGLTTAHSPCTAADSINANPGADTNVATLTTPQPAWSTWYLNASPGPYYPCVTASGSPPAFDNDQGLGSSPDAGKENLSLTGAGGVVYLTPGTSYSCRTPNGELSWNLGSRLLTVNGAIFIDGNVGIDSSGTIAYSGIGTIFSSGSFVLKGTSLCAVVAANGKDCDWQAGAGHWDPNTRFLEIVAGDKQACCAPDVPAGDVSVELSSVSFQGGIEAANRIDVSTSSSTQGP